MQTETSILPVVQLNVHRTITRKAKPSKDSATLESKKLSPCRNTLFPSSKKCLNPLLGAPYRDTMKQQSLSEEPKSSNKSILGQRVMSAKILRFKQLQNQLADAHYHLNELANENRLLKALQKRQDSALRRYEGANAELPRLINSHHEELRVLQTKYKKLKELHKDTCNLLKERENELYSANSQNKHLLQLSKDRNLEEREKLQLQLTDMNYKMQQQQETIQLLHRKLTLETKSLKHQLHIEISKHKETQKNLQETIEKLKSLECLLDNREKRLYYNSQLPIYNKEKNLGSHSLTNLSFSNPIKSSNRSKRSKNGPKDNLPSLDILESNDDEKVTEPNNVNHNQSVDQLKSETMASLQQIRKFRLQRSPHMRKNAHSMDDLRFRSKDSEMSAHDDEKVISIDYKSILKRDELNNDQDESGKLTKLFSRIKNQNTQKLQKELRTYSFDYSSDDGESGNACEYYNQSYDTPQKSRELYVRLINSADDISDTLDDIMKKADSNEEEEELSSRLMENLTFQKHKNETKLLHHRKNDLYDSGSEDDVDSEGKINMNEDSPIEYKSNDFQTSLSKFTKEQFSKSFNGITHLEHNTLDITEQSVERLKDAQLPRISNNTSDDVNLENTEVLQQSSNLNRTWLDKGQLLKSNGIDDSFTDMKKEDCVKKEEIRYLEEKSVYADMSCDKVYHDTDNAVYEEMKHLPTLEKKKVEKDSQEAYGKESTINHFDGSIRPVHNLEKEYLKLKDETSSVMHHSDEETSDKPGANIETQNKLNATLNIDVSQTEQSNAARSEVTQVKHTNEKKITVNYNKEKLLATMKAIDDNENIEFLNQGFKDHVNRMQIMENLHRGLPAHSKPKRDIIRDIFEDNPIESKVRGTCSKSH
ncbi:PREDICTED: intracellular protein transport protein USO1 [Trachymyrmex cornetzi]|uniref:intracellular protein transport protein USO1 n=1 Tax=Trachymyrmex cornetzi TaxID=471704 RepID=UPI00084F134F|nr:PREDICTED: intracellular protein transport protein USO1 [Trachymyrmex cornetzi]